jgi:L-asparagine transporter-like permease
MTVAAHLPTPEVEGLHRRLTQRQLTMMAIGGAIGVGLFLGSSVTIRLAGPAVILSYLLGAGIALIMSYVLAEMAVVHPVAGAFGVYAEKYLNSWAGFSVRATYGVAQIIAIGAEVTAAGIYISYWLPGVPQWIWVVLVSAALVALNSMQVNRLGEFEYWFAMIKVTAIVAFIIVGLSLILGVWFPARDRPGEFNSARRLSAGGMERRMAFAHHHCYQLHGSGNHCGHCRRGRASGSYHSTRHAEHCLAAHYVLRSGDCDYGDDGSLEPDW